MRHTRKQVAHLEGLQAGLGVDVDSREGKMWAGLMAVLHAVERDLADLADHGRHLEDYIGELDEGLGDIEDIFLELEEQQGEQSSGGRAQNGRSAGAMRSPRPPRPVNRKA